MVEVRGRVCVHLWLLWWVGEGGWGHCVRSSWSEAL